MVVSVADLEGSSCLFPRTIAEMSVRVAASSVLDGGRGLFAAEDLAAGVRVAEYGGVVKPCDRIMPASSFDERGCVLDTTTFAKKMVFLKTFPFGSSDHDDSGSKESARDPLDRLLQDAGTLVLDPTDDNGDLMPEFEDRFLGLFANEPPPGTPVNAAFAFCPRRRAIEIWTLHPVATGQEIFVFYGSGYERPYLISEELCGFSNIALVLNDSEEGHQIDQIDQISGADEGDHQISQNNKNEEGVSIGWIVVDLHPFCVSRGLCSHIEPSLTLSSFLSASSLPCSPFSSLLCLAAQNS